MAQAQARSAARAGRPDGDEAGYSGRLLLRMPPELHAELARSAADAGTSLNAYINGVLTATTEAPAAPEAPPRRDRFLRVAVVADLVLVAVAAALAIVLLLVAWP